MIGLAAAGSQAGHLLVYQMLYGSAAAQAQSQGAHSYFPTLAKSALGLAAVAVIACLLIVGAGRVVAFGPRVRRTEAPAYLSLLASLFTIQLAWFILQEITEALVSGSRVAPSTLASRPKRSSTSWRSCGVMISILLASPRTG